MIEGIGCCLLCLNKFTFVTSSLMCLDLNKVRKTTSVLAEFEWTALLLSSDLLRIFQIVAWVPSPCSQLNVDLFFPQSVVCFVPVA